MINLAVINIKEVLKIIKRILIIIIFFIIITKCFVFLKNKFKNLENEQISKFESVIETKNIDDTILFSEYFNNYSHRENGLKKILVSELSAFYNEEKLMEKENQEEILEFEESKKENDITDMVSVIVPNEEEIIEINTEYSLPTQVITLNNKKDTFTNNYNSVKIKNESRYQLTSEMIIPNVELNNKKDVIIYHTHTCESYTPTPENNYQASGNYRTTDLNYSVSRVGNELERYLNKYNFNVIHDITYHDYPAYTGSYTRSLSTIKNILSKNPTSEFIIDLHRDALGSNSTYAPSVQIGDEVVAQLMFVIGTDGGGLNHPDWLYNFKLAIKIQEKANEMYPGLFKPIILRDSRYNQHVAKGAVIIEVGATGNTLEQCNGSMKYLSNIISEVIK